MKQVIITLTAVFFISLAPLNGQVLFTGNQQSAKVDFSAIDNGNEEAIRNIEVRIEKGLEKLEEVMEGKNKLTISFDDQILTISFSTKNQDSFYFLGNEYQDLDEIEKGIEEEEKELKKNGYFLFMNEWYPSLELMESMTTKQIQAGSFKFMGERFAPMPSEIFG